MLRLKNWMLMVFYGVLYLLPLNLRPLWIPDETRYAEISREMLARGDWVVPHLMGLRYFEKPIAGYWVNSISQWLFGDNHFAVRFGQALASGLSAWLVFWLACRMWQHEGEERAKNKAHAATLIYLSCALVYGIGTYAVLDAMVTFWFTACMAAFYLTLDARTTGNRLGAYAMMGVACGMGFLTKGFIALAVPVVAIAPFMIQQKRFLELVKFGMVPIVVAGLVSAPWALLVNMREPDYWHYFFWIEHIKRFSSPNAQHKQPIWFYLPILLVGVLPWTGILPAALRNIWRDAASRRNVIYLVCWVTGPLVFFSIAKGKLATYILPCYAPLALLLGAGLANLLESRRLHPLKVNGVLNVLVGLGLALFVAIAAMHSKNGYPYGPHDTVALTAGIVVFVLWALFGLVQWLRPHNLWYVPALTMLPVALLLPIALPQQLMDNKMPGYFIDDHLAALSKSPTLLTDDVGIAAALGWKLKRSDVVMLDNKGELEYGLSYPDAANRYMIHNKFAPWLQEKLKLGPVAIMTRGEPPEFFNNLPTPDAHFRRGRYDMLLYGIQDGTPTK